MKKKFTKKMHNKFCEFMESYYKKNSNRLEPVPLEELHSAFDAGFKSALKIVDKKLKMK
jgi:hypothetical protein